MVVTTTSHLLFGRRTDNVPSKHLYYQKYEKLPNLAGDIIYRHGINLQNEAGNREISLESRKADFPNCLLLEFLRLTLHNPGRIEKLQGCEID